MTTIKTTLLSGLVALGLSTGLAFAQAPTAGTTPLPGGTSVPPPKSTVVTPPPATVPPVKAKSAGARKQALTPEGQACSAEADTQNLHGASRVKFRKKCIADKRKAAGAPAPAKKL